MPTSADYLRTVAPQLEALITDFPKAEKRRRRREFWARDRQGKINLEYLASIIMYADSGVNWKESGDEASREQKYKIVVSTSSNGTYKVGVKEKSSKPEFNKLRVISAKDVATVVDEFQKNYNVPDEEVWLPHSPFVTDLYAAEKRYTSQ